MRQFIRHPADVPIEVRLQALDAVSTSRTNGTAKLHSSNVSMGGLAFEFGADVPLGTIVEVRIPWSRPPFETQARVVWCRAHDAAHFDLGVEFLNPEDAFRARMVEQVCQIERYRTRVREEEGRELSSDDAALEWIQKYAASFQ
jgi:hypothetical protein